MDCYSQQMIGKAFLWDTSILRNLWNFDNLLKYFTVTWPGAGTRN